MLRRSFAELWPAAPEPVAVKQDDAMVSLDWEGWSAVVAMMPAPIPWADLEGPCATSLYWDDAADELMPHKAHAIVTVTGTASELEMTKRLTRITAAVLRGHPCVLGVYWGQATLVIPKDMFVELASGLDTELPLPLWLDTRIVPGQGQRISGFTYGMKALGHMDLAANNCPESPQGLVTRFLNIASYLLEHGPVIKDGDTVGERSDEKIRVRYGKSAFGHAEPIMMLEYEPRKSLFKRLFG